MGRPSKPLITRERAARAALGVIDVQGLDSLSLELVARRIGVKAPSLYYHFHDKTELLAEVARLMLVDIEPPAETPGDWEENVIKLCVAVRRSILQHPNAAPLLLQFFPRLLLLPSYDRALAEYPFPPEDQMMVVEGVEKLTFGSAFFEAAARARSIEPMPPFDPVKLPNLASAIRSNTLGDEEMFVETIRCFMTGARARLAAKDRAAASKPAEPAAPRRVRAAKN
jgi:AcrR family transcriptional regulator